MVMLALAVAAFFSYRTRSKIWRYGKPNIYWDRPLIVGTEGRDVEDWVSFHITTYSLLGWVVLHERRITWSLIKWHTLIKVAWSVLPKPMKIKNVLPVSKLKANSIPIHFHVQVMEHSSSSIPVTIHRTSALIRLNCFW